MESAEKVRPTQGIWRIILDLFWASSGRLKHLPGLEPAWPQSFSFNKDTIDAAYEALKEEHAAEVDRIRLIETKLLGITSLAPVAMAVVVAGFTVLANGSIHSFTRTSVVLIGVVEGYVCLQLLRAVLGAISGLRRRSFYGVSLDELY